MVSTNIIKNVTLSGVRVLCIEDLIALPWGTMYLADLGADVIRAESHTRLRARAWGPFPNGVADPDKWWNQGGSHGLYYRNKKSLTLDLTKPEGIQLLKELVKVTDIVAENSRPGVMDRLGIGYDTLKQIKPDLIMIGSSGFGQTGDLRYVLYNWLQRRWPCKSESFIHGYNYRMEYGVVFIVGSSSSS